MQGFRFMAVWFVLVSSVAFEAKSAVGVDQWLADAKLCEAHLLSYRLGFDDLITSEQTVQLFETRAVFKSDQTEDSPVVISCSPDENRSGICMVNSMQIAFFKANELLEKFQTEEQADTDNSDLMGVVGYNTKVINQDLFLIAPKEFSGLNGRLNGVRVFFQELRYKKSNFLKIIHNVTATLYPFEKPAESSMASGELISNPALARRLVVGALAGMAGQVGMDRAKSDSSCRSTLK